MEFLNLFNMKNFRSVNSVGRGAMGTVWIEPDKYFHAVSQVRVLH